jgi:hypothetical protein
MKRAFEIKREIDEKKKKTAEIKDCPNKLISLLGVKKTPQSLAVFTLIYLSISDTLFFFSF